MSAGRSARVKASELREQAIQLHAKAMQREAEAEKYEAGATGEERVAAVLDAAASDTVDGRAVRVLHDRLLRPDTRSKGNIDHLVVSGAGVFVVDAKNWTGVASARDGSLWQQRTPADARRKRDNELQKVHAARAVVQAAIGHRVTPVLCLAGDESAAFGPAQELHGVHVVPVDELRAWLAGRPAPRRSVDVDALAGELTRRYPEAGGAAQAVPVPVAVEPPAARPWVHVPIPRRRRFPVRRTAQAAVGLAAVVALVVAGPRLLSTLTRAVTRSAVAAPVSSTPPARQLSAARTRVLGDWAVRAGLYEAHDEPSSLPYVPDSNLGTQSQSCRTQKAGLKPFRHDLLAAPDKILAAGAKRYDRATHDLLAACIHDHPVALHHARSRMDAAASAVDVRYNRLFGIDPTAYDAKRVL